MNLGFLQRLERLKETGPDRWIACCPAHEDRSPSLSIRYCDDGRVLLHCFAGCDVEDVLSAIGLTFPDIMPEPIGGKHSYRPMRSRFDARQVLECVTHETIVVCLLAEKMLSRETLTQSDDERLTLAAQRLNTAVQYAPPLRTPPEIRAIRSGSK